jgi:methionyl-tRNA synthetase
MLTDMSRFLADRYVEGICPHCGYDDARGDQCDGCSRTLDAIELIKPRCLVNKTHKVTTKHSAHMYLKLNEIQPRTEEWIKASWKKGKWSANAVINSDGEIIDARMKGGLLPTPLTRDLKWGVPVPIEGEDTDGMSGKVLYVWVCGSLYCLSLRFANKCLSLTRRSAIQVSLQTLRPIGRSGG